MAMPFIIEKLSDPVCVFCIFVIFLFCFHVLFFCLRPIGNVGWKYIEYIVLIFALSGIVVQSSQVRKIWYDGEYNLSKYSVENSYFNFKRIVDDLRNL